MYDLDDHLAGGHRPHHFRAHRTATDLFDKGFDDIERHIGFDQSQTHFPQSSSDIGFAQRPAPR